MNEELRLREVNALVRSMCAAKEGIALKVGITRFSPRVNCLFFFNQFSRSASFIYRKRDGDKIQYANIFALDEQYMCIKIRQVL